MTGTYVHFADAKNSELQQHELRRDDTRQLQSREGNKLTHAPTFASTPKQISQTPQAIPAQREAQRVCLDKDRGLRHGLATLLVGFAESNNASQASVGPVEGQQKRTRAMTPLFCAKVVEGSTIAIAPRNELQPVAEPIGRESSCAIRRRKMQHAQARAEPVCGTCDTLVCGHFKENRRLTVAEQATLDAAGVHGASRRQHGCLLSGLQDCNSTVGYSVYHNSTVCYCSVRKASTSE